MFRKFTNGSRGLHLSQQVRGPWDRRYEPSPCGTRDLEVEAGEVCKECVGSVEFDVGGRSPVVWWRVGTGEAMSAQ